MLHWFWHFGPILPGNVLWFSKGSLRNNKRHSYIAMFVTQTTNVPHTMHTPRENLIHKVLKIFSEFFRIIQQLTQLYFCFRKLLRKYSSETLQITTNIWQINIMFLIKIETLVFVSFVEAGKTVEDLQLVRTNECFGTYFHLTQNKTVQKKKEFWLHFQF